MIISISQKKLVEQVNVLKAVNNKNVMFDMQIKKKDA